VKLKAARSTLHAAGFATVPFNKACTKGTPASQSVVAALSVPGRPPDVKVGSAPLAPGTLRPKGSSVGITWSGCYPSGTEVPLVTGHTFASAVRKLHLAGLDWACDSSGPVTTTTAAAAATTSSSAATTTAAGAPATTTTAPKTPRVLSQSIAAGSVVPAKTVVTLVLRHCPQ
jgi:beta-lactam-binding protein with PASTA domain